MQKNISKNLKTDSAQNKSFSTIEIDPTATIQEGVHLKGVCKVGANSFVGAGTVIEDSIIGDNVVIKSSFIEESVICSNATVGPFAHIRPNSKIENGAKIGNFVEIKNSIIGAGSKVSHLAYVGDAEIGKNCNIGCGAIFVNYNGKCKQKTIVGDGCFVGSNCNVIAPVVIAKNTYICAGTTLTKNTNAGDFVIGRARETIKQGRAKDYLKEMF